jgi:hypothetical protein
MTKIDIEAMRDKIQMILERAKDGLEPLEFLEMELLDFFLVSKSLPTDEEIEIQAEKALFGFGKGRQYDDDYWTGYEHGAKWIRDKSNVC